MPGMMPLSCSIFTNGVPSLAFWYSVSSYRICGGWGNGRQLRYNKQLEARRERGRVQRLLKQDLRGIGKQGRRVGTPSKARRAADAVLNAGGNRKTTNCTLTYN